MGVDEGVNIPPRGQSSPLGPNHVVKNWPLRAVFKFLPMIGAKFDTQCWAFVIIFPNKIGDLDTKYLHTSVARFILAQYTKMAENIANCQILPNGRKHYQMVIKNGHILFKKTFSIPRPSKIYPKIYIFGLKIYHLATLHR
jgi:hypothetical protein